MERKILYTIILVSFFSCTGKFPNKNENKENTAKFTLPEIPSVVTDTTEQLKYLADHYWDNYNFKDTVFIHSELANHVFTGYLDLLSRLPVEISAEDIKELMEKSKADSVVCMGMFSLCEKNLYDPNSPIRNERLYMEVLRQILSWKRLNKVYKIRPEHQYELALKNRPGEAATDFKFTFANGKSKNLYDICADYVLVYFNNPGCGDCKRVGGLLARSNVINQLINSGKLRLLSVYPDNEITEWKKNSHLFSASWINVYDKGAIIKTKELYDLRAIPTLYLLDRKKKVLLKDAPFEYIESYLNYNKDSIL